MWLSIHLPLLPLEVHQKKTRGIGYSTEQSQLAVSENQYILLCTQHAINSGIEAGLTCSTALSICGDLNIQERDPHKEIATLKELAKTAYQFSSHVVPYTNLHQQHSLILEIAGSIKLFKGLDNLLSKINSVFFERNKCRIAIGETLKAAELLARCPSSCLSSSLSNSFSNSPSIDNAPVSLLDSPPKIISQCQNMGLAYLGDLIALPNAALAKRFNKEFIRYLNELRGSDISRVKHFRPAEYFKQELFYIDGLRSHDDLLHPIKKLLEELCTYLQKRQVKCLGISWLFIRFSKQKNVLPISFSQPQCDYANIFLLTQLQLDQIPLDSPIESVELKANQFFDLSPKTPDFFNRNTQHSDPFLLADKIIGKLGENALKIIQVSNHYLPEEKNRLVSLNSQSNKNVYLNEPGLFPDGENHSFTQPTWLLDKPIKLDKKDNTLYRGRLPLQIIKGSERIESNWWENKASRDYFIAGLKNNSNEYQAFYWVYYDRLSKHWYLHGLFS